MKKSPLFILACLMLCTVLLKAQVINLPKPVYTYKQNFDTLAATGTSSKLPNGWYMYETGTAANATYTADSGASATGDTYSYGHAGSTDRSLGTLSTSSEESYIGAQLKNSTGYSINSITISFTVEQWRLGATGRADSLTAEVTTLATSLSAGFWVSLPLLNFRSPVTSGSTGQIDGNNSTNRKKFTYTISGVAVANGSNIWVRWHDRNISGSNDGLAIDDFSISVKAYIPHTIAASKFPQALGIPDTTQTGLWKGVVLSQNYTTGGLNFAFHDNTGSITAISTLKTYGYTPAIGDSVAVYGQIMSNNYLTYIAADSVGLISGSHSTGTLKTVTSINSDTLESDLVKINKMSLSPGYKWDTTGAGKNGGFMTTMTNGVNTYNVWIAKNSDLYGKPAPKFPYNLVGVVLQNSTSPASGYYLWPRNMADFDTIRLPLYKIAQVRGQNPGSGVADSAGNGHLIFLKGVVQSPSFTSPDLMFSFNDNTGTIFAFSSTVKNYIPVAGDSVLVRGTMSQSGGITEIIADSIKTLKKGAGVIKTAKSIASPVESNEADVLKFKNATIVDKTAWVPAGAFFMVKYTNGTDTIDVRINNNTDLFKLSSAPVGKYNISGIGGQAKGSAPYTSGYQLWPRGITDYEKILPFSPVPLYKISQLKGYNVSTGVADSVNKGSGFMKGVVHSASFSGSALQFSFIDNTGAITIFSSVVKNYTPVIGDSLLIRGKVIQTNGLTEYNADSIIVLTKSTILKSPTIVTKPDESTESDLIILKNVYLTDTTSWVAAGTGFNVKITNGVDTFIMHISSTTDLFSKRPLKGRFNITGIGSQDKASAPYTSGYFIEPRGMSDFEHLIQLYKIREIRGQNATSGVADSVSGKTKFLVKGVVQSPDFTSPGLNFSLKDSTGVVFVSAAAQVNGYKANVGDSIEVRGLVTQTNGLTAIAIDSVSKPGNWPVVFTPAVVTKLTEPNEAALVRFTNAWLVDPSEWVSTGAGFNADITNGKDTITIYVSSATSMFGRPAPKWRFNVTGIEAQLKAAAPYFGGYFLLPRGKADFEYLPYNLYNISQVKPINPASGIADSINLYCMLQGVVHSYNLSGNTTQFLSFKDKTGAIFISSATVIKSYVPNIGDSLLVRGWVRQANGLTYFEMDSLSKMTAGGVAMSPVVVTNLDEKTESDLVTLNTYQLVDPSKWDTTGAKGHLSVKAYNGNDTITLSIVAGTDLYLNSAKPFGYFDVTGIGCQADITNPYLQNYFLIPRSVADFKHSTGIPMKNIEGDVNVYPNPAVNQVVVESVSSILTISLLDVTGRVLVLKNPVSKITSVDLNEFKKGVYFLKISTSEGNMIKKIIKD